MPNQKSKEAKRAAKFAADEELTRAARKALLEEERTQLRIKAAENTRAGKPSVITHLARLPVRQRKLQKKDAKSKQRLFSKSKIPGSLKTHGDF